MKRLTQRISVLFVIASLLLPSWPVFAVDESMFNPNYILSDEEMQNWQSMNREDIQAFLESQGGYISRWNTADVDGNYRPVSDIIYQAAIRHRINPKYILVKLQKEQSLISEEDPTQKQLDWATGYGICDSCSMNDPALQKHKGFGIQVDSAAGIIRWYYDNVATQAFIKRANAIYSIDNTLVQPATLATAFLYTYTPHIHGNQNFWVLWQRWFQQVYPDGTLAQAPNDSVIYLIQQGKKRAFTTMTALASRFDPKMIITVPEAELSRYETGPTIKLPNYSILRVGGQYYLLDNETVRPFADVSVVTKLGYNPDEIIDITTDDLQGLSIGGMIGTDTSNPLGRLVKAKENNQLYYLANGMYQHISDAQIAKNRFPHLTAETVPITDLANYVPGAPVLLGDGILFGIQGSNKIYVTEKGRKRHIPTEQIFNALGYSWKNIIWVDEFTGINHPTGSPLSAPQTTVANSSNVVGQTPDEIPTETQPSIPSVMVDVPDADTTVTGPVFETAMDTYLVANAETGEILAGKNIDTVRPMASFAKIMTGYTLLKEGLSLANSVSYDPAKHKATYHNFRTAPGERFLNEHLMYATLISSLNTPTNMLIGSVEKNRSAFVARLNTQAKEWGLMKTVFLDPNGEEVDTVTTAREYLTIYTKATGNADIERLLGMPSYQYAELMDTDGKPNHYDTHSNELMERTNLPFRILWSKTGYLDEAGNGLAMTIERPSDKKKFTIITMGNPEKVRKFDEPERFARWVIANF